MENATKAIIIAASVVITMAIVSFGFLIMNRGTGEVSKWLEKFGIVTKQIEENEYMVYDGKEVYGNDVISAIDKAIIGKEHVGIYVVTKGGENWYCNDASDLNNLKDLTNPRYVEDVTNSDTYINPLGKFVGSVTRADNGNIAAVTFTQQ